MPRPAIALAASLLSLAALAACDAPARVAAPPVALRSAAAYVDRYSLRQTDLTFSIDFPSCIGETVDFTGTVHYEIRWVYNDGVRSPVLSLRLLQASGVGRATQRHYQLIDLDRTADVGTSSGVESEARTVIQRFRLTSEGSTQDYVATTTAHLTYDPAGNLVAWFENTSVDCGP